MSGSSPRTPPTRTEGLERFVAAQEGVIETALAELRAGAKQTHWMWFLFPQLRGLGSSAMAQHYGIEDLAEARAYLEHGVLGPRLVLCTEAVLAAASVPLARLFGAPDDRKFHSSMTLFDRAAGGADPFARALAERFGGVADAATLRLLGQEPTGG